MLAAKKVGNEVFNMSNEDGTFNQALWNKTVGVIREINETSGLALPESVEVIEERKERKKKEAAEIRSELVQKRKAEREAERESPWRHGKLRFPAEAAERKRRKKEEKAAEEKAKQEQLARERAAHCMEVETETSELLNDFIINRCKIVSNGRVAVSDFQKAFAEYTGQDTPRMFSSIMLKKGFSNKTLAIEGVKMKSYSGLVLGNNA